MYDETHIEIIDNSKFQPELDPLYVVLGMLCEYSGRTIFEDDKIVEGFFPNEYKIALLFKKHLEELKGRLGFKGKISLIKSGGHSSILSAEMANYINNLFPHDFEDCTIVTDIDGKIHRKTISGISDAMFPQITTPEYLGIERNPRYSYLYGAYLREGSKDELAYRIANSSHKVEMIKLLLEEMDCEWISHWYSVRGAPCMHYVTFGADAKLLRLLNQARDEKTNA